MSRERRSRKKFEPVRVLKKRLFQKNKGRNLVAVLAILMTTMMFATLFTLAQSMSENLVEMTFRQTGYDAQVSFKSITSEQAKILANHPDVKEVGESTVLGLAENKALSGKQVEIRWADESYASHSFCMPATGHLPEKENEAALDTVTLKRLGVEPKLGETVTLEWRKDLSDPEAERISSTFTLCGFWEGNESVYASMAWVSKPYVETLLESGTDAVTDGNVFGMHMAQVTLHHDRNIENTMKQILSDTRLTDLEFHVNLAYSPEMGATALQETLPMYLGMILVFLAGYLIIYNIFQISVTADVQFYGKLKTLGMTTKQIKKLIFGQSNLLCLIGIPAGLLSGWLLGMVLVPAFTGIIEGESRVSASPVIFIGSAVFAWLTVWISCMRPARLAGKVSPVEALRMSDADGKSKKSRRKKEQTSLASMAWANLGRNKKRTITVICSLTLGLVLLSCFYAKNAAFDMEKYLENLTIADFELSQVTSEDYIGGYDPKGDTLNETLVKTLESFDGVESTGHQYSAQFTWKMDEQTRKNLQSFYTEEMLADWSTYDPSGVEAFHKAVDNGEMSAVIFCMDGIPLEAVTQEAYIMEGTFDPEAFASGNYVLAVGPAIEQDEVYPSLPAPSVGNTIELAGKPYEVMAVVYPLMPIDDGASEMGAPASMEMHFILPTDAFQAQWPENTLRRLFVNVDDAHVNEMQEWIETYTEHEDSSLPVASRKTMAEQYERETRSSAVMGNAISIIIALVGVLNFINSMVTAIVSRRREFAMIQSVGMTKKQLCRMLVYEGLYYAGITLAASYLISAAAVGVGIRAMVEGGFTTFHFTLLPLMICTPILLIFAILIPYLCFKNLEKQSIVERLRME